jgi:hypothetical protein
MQKVTKVPADRYPVKVIIISNKIDIYFSKPFITQAVHKNSSFPFLPNTETPNISKI